MTDAVAEPVKVSVVVSTYNHERFVAEALESVVRQETAVRFEVLVADDSSTDGTWEVVRSYGERYPALVRPMRSAANAGDGGKAFFAATLAHCAGEYTAFLDGDDYWTDRSKLQYQADQLDREPDVALCFHNVVKVDEAGAVVLGHVHPESIRARFELKDLLARCFIASCSPMFRTRTLQRLPAWYFGMPWGDWPLYMLAAMEGQVAYDDRVMGAYRIHGGGMWSGIDVLQRNRELIAFYGTLEEVLPVEHRGSLRREASIRWATLAAELAARGVWRDAGRAAVRAVLTKPVGRHHQVRRVVGAFLRGAKAKESSDAAAVR